MFELARHLAAASGKNLRADLYLDVGELPGRETGLFSMELGTSPFPTRAQQLAAAEQTPSKYRVQKFQGVILDPSGAGVAGVGIEVVRGDTGGQERVAQLKSGGDGRFSAPLADAFYVAILSVAGFRVEIAPLEVTSQESESMQITLQLGSVP